ncbi:hypothetical protein FOVG_18994 [Fusarium oxysporum f. sp. pisi HDV247]|uniref:Uncharacterized protein n=1 Tax=Fusarium oxysporum f. sp. pisi HDV247 TaxID=1080344 RepID=W9NA58_FUSOX|nr:hypothetical protein FOVG_18994 [Fusarium oxysporum f. sp. pisi HDV247]
MAVGRYKSHIVTSWDLPGRVYRLTAGGANTLHKTKIPPVSKADRTLVRHSLALESTYLGTITSFRMLVTNKEGDPVPMAHEVSVAQPKFAVRHR